jgi:ribosomal protein S18 acetylase RimI-like enzyme
MSTSFDIAECTSKNAHTFADIFVPWLKMTTGKDPEPEDSEALIDPETFYVMPGGMVFLAYLDSKPVACVALKKLDEDRYELCKLVVLESARGSGLGKKLVERCITYTKTNGGREIWLQTFKKLDVAIGMYHRMGFIEHKPPKAMNVLARTEIIMALNL